MQLGPAEILVVLVIALLVFGPNKLPEVGRQVGRAYREVRRFQRSLSSEMSDVFADDVSDGAAPAPSLPPLPRTSDDAGDDEQGDDRSGAGRDAADDAPDVPDGPASGDEKAER